MNIHYQRVLSKFCSTEKITDYSLSKIRLACEYFGNPQDSFKSIHIAGTNGKGSVSKMIFQMLKESGKRVGVYTSPHNIDIRERFEVGNCKNRSLDFFIPCNDRNLISEEDFVRIAEMIITYNEELSYYEKCTLLSFLYFREQGCEYAVIEVGMGGRFDATNIITPMLSVITSISYDHIEFLGNTLEQIATEKGGIIKNTVPVILYGNNETLEKIAQDRDSKVIFPESREIHTNMIGAHQEFNSRIAYEAGVFLGIGEDIIQSALLHVEHLGRLQYLLPNLLIDGAHNEDGMKKLQIYLCSHRGSWDEIVYCVNLKKGKSSSLFLEIFPHVHDWVIVHSEHQMVESSEKLSHELIQNSIRSMIVSPKQVLSMARKNPKKLFVVFGSLYMIGEFLTYRSYE